MANDEVLVLQKPNLVQLKILYAILVTIYKQIKRRCYLERATLPHCLHLGLLSPRSVFGGPSVRCTMFTAAEAAGMEAAEVAVAVAGTAEVALVEGRATVFGAVTVAAAEVLVAVPVPVSELLLLRAGEGAAMKAKLFAFSFEGFCAREIEIQIGEEFAGKHWLIWRFCSDTGDSSCELLRDRWRVWVLILMGSSLVFNFGPGRFFEPLTVNTILINFFISF